MNKLCGSLIAVGTLIGMVFGYYFWMESRYALAQQLTEERKVRTQQLEEEKQARKALEQRVDYKIKSDQSKGIQSRIWQLQDRCKTLCDLTSKEELRSLQADLEDTKVQLRQMEKK